MRSRAVRCATIDVGTNTLSYLVAEVDGTTVRPLEDGEQVVGLGEGLDRAGALSEPAMARTERALGDVAERARLAGVARVAAVGTQALREARNAGEFLARATRRLGAPIEVVSGELEAALTFRGVAAAFADGERPLVVLDIGAGSTELILGRGAALQAASSVAIGSVRLTERLLATDPPTAAQLAELDQVVMDALGPLAAPAAEPLVAVAGTATTLLALARRRSLEPAEIEAGRLGLPELDALFGELSAAGLDRRREMPGMVAGRAPYLVAGAAILRAVARLAGVREIRISGRGVRWGLMYRRFVDLA